MARVTVEDCIDKVENRFDLVLLAAHRARLLHNGEEPTLPKNNDKAGVVALREIAEQTITVNDLREEIIKSLQLYHEDEIVDEDSTLIKNQENQENEKDQNIYQLENIETNNELDSLELQESQEYQGDKNKEVIGQIEQEKYTGSENKEESESELESANSEENL